jgi:hypothetical protein
MDEQTYQIIGAALEPEVCSTNALSGRMRHQVNREPLEKKSA